jgi:hypothetical protein
MTKRTAARTKPKASKFYDQHWDLVRERDALIAARDKLIALHFKKLTLATQAAYKQGFKTGVFCSSEIADSSNKLNQTTRRRPRRNLKAIKAIKGTRTSLVGATIYQPDIKPSPAGKKLLKALES